MPRPHPKNEVREMALDSVKQGGVAFVDGRSAFRSKEPVPAHHMQDLVDTGCVGEGWTVLIYNASMGEVVDAQVLGGEPRRHRSAVDRGFSDAEAFHRAQCRISHRAGHRGSLRRPGRADRGMPSACARAFPLARSSCCRKPSGRTISRPSEWRCATQACAARCRGCLQAGSAGRLGPTMRFFTVAPCGPCRGIRSRAMSSHTAPAPVPAPAQVESRNATTRLASVWASAWGGRTTEVCLTCGVGLLFGVGLSLMF